MSNMTKSQWVTSGAQMRLTMPFAKVDTENRLVSGYATLDNIDSQGDIVLAEASAKAFARARGNIREMHQPVAAGRLVDFREDEYYDTETQKFYRGIYVTAYVSKGAESTWEKVLDGTLTGFSIGGNILDSSNEFVKEANGGEGAQVRFIKEYDLVELSLVDNPANQLANVFSIVKAADGSVTKMTGMVAETKVENIFWCETDGIARTSESDDVNCLTCGKPMNNIGWVESGEQKEEKVRTVVAKFLSRSKDSTAVNDAESEGGVDVSKFLKSNSGEGQAVEGVDEAGATNTPEGTQDADLAAQPVEATDQAAAQVDAQTEEPQTGGEPVLGVDEVQDESDELSKKLDTLTDAVTRVLEDREVTVKAVTALNEKVDSLAKTLDEKTSDFETLSSRLGEISENLATAKSSVADLEKSLSSMNDADAVKKSAELEKSAETKQKENPWGGAFSVNNLLR